MQAHTAGPLGKCLQGFLIQGAAKDQRAPSVDLGRCSWVQLERQYVPPLECVFEEGIHKHAEARKSSLAFHVFLFIICVCEGCEYGLTHAPAHTEAMALKEAERILSLQTASRVFCLQKELGGGDDTLGWPQGAPATLRHMENLGTRLS